MQPIFRELLILMIVVWVVAVVLRRVGAPKRSTDRPASRAAIFDLGADYFLRYSTGKKNM